jgi:photosystem II stability/assembly factor-like uncharacterized protein
MPAFFKILLMKYILHIILIITALSISACTGTGSNTAIQGFTWQQSYLGGGGYITGLIQHPQNADILYARCDVAGLFKSEDAGKTWRLINRGLEKGYNQNTESVSISPHNPNILFRASGEARNHTMEGEIHKSVDGGESWYSVSTAVDFFGNGPNRMLGERISVDPFDENIVVAGGFSSGVWMSGDNGETWVYSGLSHEPIINVRFHPYKEGLLYAATLRDMEMKEYLGIDNDRPLNGRLFVSDDKGRTWKLLYEKQGLDFTQLEFTAENPNRIIAATRTHGILISEDGGVSFKEKNKGLPRELGFNTIAADPHNPGVMYTAANRRGRHTHVPLVPLYKTTDGGESWQLLHDYDVRNFTEYPSYIRTHEHIGWAISTILVDNKNPQRLFMTNWYGVSVSNDGGVNWSGNNFVGTETVCIENLVVDKVSAGRSGFVMPDHRPFIGQDFGNTYKQVAAITEYKNSTALVFSRFNPDVIIFAGKIDWMGEHGSAILLSKDNGESFGLVKEFTDMLTVQALKEDPHTPGTFWAYIDRFIDKGAGLYRSQDWGETWHQVNLELPAYIRTLPHQMHFIENELLSVTLGQQKNVVGTNQLLCIDPHRQGTIYLGEWTEGLFRTTDDGATWQDISRGLPFKKDTTSVIVDIKADANRAGVVYAGFIREGLWKSTDYGDTWEKVFPLDDRLFNASSIAVGGYDSQEIIVASEPLFWSPSPSAVYLSRDAGKTFTNIYDNAYGALRWKSIGIDPDKGTIYGVTCGNGAFYATREGLKSNFNLLNIKK